MVLGTYGASADCKFKQETLLRSTRHTRVELTS